METTLQDLLHAINVLGTDMDVAIIDIDSIAVCAPVKMTPAGRERFKEVLAARVVTDYSDLEYVETYVCDDDEDVNRRVWKLLVALAGNVSERDFEAWFEGEDAEMI